MNVNRAGCFTSCADPGGPPRGVGNVRYHFARFTAGGGPTPQTLSTLLLVPIWPPRQQLLPGSNASFTRVFFLCWDVASGRCAHDVSRHDSVAFGHP